jgi:hypothetical protein
LPLLKDRRSGKPPNQLLVSAEQLGATGPTSSNPHTLTKQIKDIPDMKTFGGQTGLV